LVTDEIISVQSEVIMNQLREWGVDETYEHFDVSSEWFISLNQGFRLEDLLGMGIPLMLMRASSFMIVPL